MLFLFFKASKRAEREGRTKRDIRGNFVWARLAKGARSFLTHYILKRHTMALFMRSRKQRDGRSCIKLSRCTLPSLYVHVWYDIDKSICLRLDPRGSMTLWHHLLFCSDITSCNKLDIYDGKLNHVLSGQDTGVLFSHWPTFACVWIRKVTFTSEQACCQVHQETD